MEKIIDKNLIPNIRDIVISYADEYKHHYDYVIWQLRIYHRDGRMHEHSRIYFKRNHFNFYFVNVRYARVVTLLKWLTFNHVHLLRNIQSIGHILYNEQRTIQYVMKYWIPGILNR